MFVKLTESHQKKTVRVNPVYIRSYYAVPDDKSCHGGKTLIAEVFVSDGRHQAYEVEESPEEIDALMDEVYGK